MALEPHDQLALAVQQYKGLFALLIGSGVSRSAGIPTGWEIIQDLIRLLAVARSERPPDVPEDWYIATFDEAPDYSNVIQRVARTREQRAHILRQYFEPSPQDVENGLKQPTAAHHAIAKLVAGGYVRIIVTTNFDRLLERAIESAGVVPAIISTRDQIKGMMPIQHTGCLVFKVHGDYLDTRIRNVTDELATYDRDTNRLLDRILAEYGLVVCGWSAKWDTALRDAICRNIHHRFSTFWMARTTPQDDTADLVAHSRATFVPIESADQSFPAIAERVEAIDKATVPSADSTDMAVALCKRFLTRAEPRIALHDLVIGELEKLISRLGPGNFSLHDKLEPLSYIDREATYRSLSTPLASVACACALWGGPYEAALVVRVINSLGKGVFEPSGHCPWLHLALLPSALVFHAAGIAALSQDRLSFLAALFDGIAIDRGSGRGVWKEELASANVLESRHGEWLLHVDQTKHRLRTPASDWLAKVLPEIVSPIAGRDLNYEDAFDDFEALYALVVRLGGGSLWPARYMRRGYERGESAALTKLGLQLKSYTRQKALTEGGILKQPAEEALRSLKEIADYGVKICNQ